MAEVLVTGGMGFIGSYLTEELIEEGHDVTVIDNLSHGTKENVKSVLDRLNFIEEDILNQKVLEEAVKGKKYIFHLCREYFRQYQLGAPVLERNARNYCHSQITRSCLEK